MKLLRSALSAALLSSVAVVSRGAGADPVVQVTGGDLPCVQDKTLE
jgi:hypothetical protein